MDNQLLFLREEYGDVFVIRLPDGQDIPWRPLSVQENLKFDQMYEAGVYPPAYIEDQIFKTAVLDRGLVGHMNKLKAGIVQAVAVAIRAHSGPSSIDELNYLLDLSRQKITGITHQLVTFICTAFPAYKPEDIYAMDYSTLMIRAAQAEDKMISAGLTDERLTFERVGIDPEEAAQQQAANEERRKKNESLIDDWYAQEGITVPESVKERRKLDRRDIIPDDTPFVPAPTGPTKERTIITKSDMIEHQSMMSGHEKDVVNHKRAADETAEFYSDYLDQLKDGKELKIMTPEERKAAAEARMAENKKANEERYKQLMEQAKEERAELLKVREEARKRKAKRAARRQR